MKAADLRELVSGATALPWQYDDVTGDIEAPKGGPNELLPKSICQMYIGNYRRNVELILAMVNHAGPLAELLAACEAERDAVCTTQAYHYDYIEGKDDECFLDIHCSACPVTAARKARADALARVETAGSEAAP